MQRRLLTLTVLAVLWISLAGCRSTPGTRPSTSSASPPLLLSSLPAYRVLHVLSADEGLAVRGSLVETRGRLYGLAGERGPQAAPNCSSTASWPTDDHLRRCPGTLFSLALDGSDARVEHAFTPLDAERRNADGYHPYGSLVLGPDGRLYGVTQAGGSPPDQGRERIPGFGVLFAYAPGDAPGAGTFRVLHTFFARPRAADGEFPMGALAVDARGRVFGTAKGGGTHGTGVAWRWTPATLDGSSAETFQASDLTGESYGGLALAGGLLHGTTWSGGLGVGSYVTVDPDSLEVVRRGDFTPYAESAHGTDNTPIQAPLARSDGTVVAAREFGGAAGAGVLVALDPARGILPLQEFRGISLETTPRFSSVTGSMPNGQLAEGADGMVYGVAQYGGAAGTGGIYRAARDGSMFRLVYSFPGPAYPYGGLARGSDGALYGVTFGDGQVFRFDPRALDDSGAPCGTLP